MSLFALILLILFALGTLNGLLVVLSLLASAYPDGLEWVAAQKGFLDAARHPSSKVPFKVIAAPIT
jgi:hypothetical protein